MLTAGQYINRRGETLELKEFNESKLCANNRYYSKMDGTCFFWSTENERFFMDTDPKSDLDLKATGHGPSMTDEQRIAKLNQALELIRDVEFSFDKHDPRRHKIYAMLVSLEWTGAIDFLKQELIKKVRGY